MMRMRNENICDKNKSMIRIAHMMTTHGKALSQKSTITGMPPAAGMPAKSQLRQPGHLSIMTLTGP